MHDSDGPVRWHHFLTGADDRTIYNVSFLSSPNEWHAVGVGFSVAATLGVEGLAVLASYVLGRQTRAAPDIPHLRDAIREPVYTAIGAVLGLAARAYFGVQVSVAGGLGGW